MIYAIRLVVKHHDQPLATDLMGKEEVDTWTQYDLACYMAGCALTGFMQQELPDVTASVQIVNAETMEVVREFKW